MQVKLDDKRHDEKVVYEAKWLWFAAFFFASMLFYFIISRFKDKHVEKLVANFMTRRQKKDFDNTESNFEMRSMKHW